MMRSPKVIRAMRASTTAFSSWSWEEVRLPEMSMATIYWVAPTAEAEGLGWPSTVQATRARQHKLKCTLICYASGRSRSFTSRSFASLRTTVAQGGEVLLETRELGGLLEGGVLIDGGEAEIVGQIEGADVRRVEAAEA